MKKNDIDAKTTIDLLVTRIVSYAIITGFICFVILSVMNNILDNFVGPTSRGLYITLPLMAVIILYFIIHGICNLSTYDVFKKFKTNPSNYKKIVKYLNIFFIICIVLSIALFLELLNLNLTFQAKTIKLTLVQYKQVFSNEHISQLAQEMTNSFNFSKTNLVISTTILVLGLTISILSLIPYQRKMIVKYNTYENDSNENV